MAIDKHPTIEKLDNIICDIAKVHVDDLYDGIMYIIDNSSEPNLLFALSLDYGDILYFDPDNFINSMERQLEKQKSYVDPVRDVFLMEKVILRYKSRFRVDKIDGILNII